MAKIRIPGRVSGDRTFQQMQDAHIAAFQEIAEYEEIKGVTISGVALTTTPKAILHGLGRRPIGWRVIDKTGAGDPYRTAWDERTLTLRVASGTLTVDLRVF